MDAERAAGLYDDGIPQDIDMDTDNDSNQKPESDAETGADEVEIDAEESLKVINKTKSLKRGHQE